MAKEVIGNAWKRVTVSKTSLLIRRLHTDQIQPPNCPIFDRKFLYFRKFPKALKMQYVKPFRQNLSPYARKTIWRLAGVSFRNLTIVDFVVLARKHKSISVQDRLVRAVEAKMSDENISGATTLLSSDDTLASKDEKTLYQLKFKHPSALQDYDYTPLNVPWTPLPRPLQSHCFLSERICWRNWWTSPTPSEAHVIWYRARTKLAAWQFGQTYRQGIFGDDLTDLISNDIFRSYSYHWISRVYLEWISLTEL